MKLGYHLAAVSSFGVLLSGNASTSGIHAIAAIHSWKHPETIDSGSSLDFNNQKKINQISTPKKSQCPWNPASQIRQNSQEVGPEWDRLYVKIMCIYIIYHYISTLFTPQIPQFCESKSVRAPEIHGSPREVENFSRTSNAPERAKIRMTRSTDHATAVRGPGAVGPSTRLENNLSFTWCNFRSLKIDWKKTWWMAGEMKLVLKPGEH